MYTPKDISRRFGQLLAAELDYLKVEVVRCPVDTLPEEDVIQSTVLVIVSPGDYQTMSLDEFCARLVPDADRLAKTIAAYSKKIFTMIQPLPHGVWSTFERLGDLGFRMVEGYDVERDVNVIRIDVLYSKI